MSDRKNLDPSTIEDSPVRDRVLTRQTPKPKKASKTSSKSTPSPSITKKPKATKKTANQEAKRPPGQDIKDLTIDEAQDTAKAKTAVPDPSTDSKIGDYLEAMGRPRDAFSSTRPGAPDMSQMTFGQVGGLITKLNDGLDRWLEGEEVFTETEIASLCELVDKGGLKATVRIKRGEHHNNDKADHDHDGGDGAPAKAAEHVPRVRKSIADRLRRARPERVPPWRRMRVDHLPHVRGHYSPAEVAAAFAKRGTDADDDEAYEIREVSKSLGYDEAAPNPHLSPVVMSVPGDLSISEMKRITEEIRAEKVRQQAETAAADEKERWARIAQFLASEREQRRSGGLAVREGARTEVVDHRVLESYHDLTAGADDASVVAMDGRQPLHSLASSPDQDEQQQQLPTAESPVEANPDQEAKDAVDSTVAALHRHHISHLEGMIKLFQGAPFFMSTPQLDAQIASLRKIAPALQSEEPQNEEDASGQ